MPDDKPMTLLAHLDELRQRLMRSLAVLLLCVMLAFSFGYETLRDVFRAPLDSLDPNTANAFAAFNPVVKWTRPMLEGGKIPLPVKLHALTVMETFIVKFKMSLVAALVVAAPYILYQLWAFVSAGLLDPERRLFRKYLPLSIVLFLAGVAFAYFLAVPLALLYLLGVDPDVELMLSYNAYFSLVLWMVAILGAAFELPLIVLTLVKIGLVTSATLMRTRRYAIVVIFVLAAVITPTPDAFNLCMVAIPMACLYEVGLWLARLSEKDAAPKP
jgi:sec-independent protein translocase protein TatC